MVVCLCFFLCVFFFKQKTAYEMRISDWSSDVCSSDLNYIFAYLGIALGLSLGGSAIGALDAVHKDLPISLQNFESWRLAFFLVAVPAPLFLVLLAFTDRKSTRLNSSH